MKLMNLLWFFSLLITGCATIHSTSLSNVSFGVGTRITGADSATSYFHLSTPAIDDLTSSLISRMKKGCENGTLGNVQTTLAMREFIIFQSYEVTITATCLTR